MAKNGDEEVGLIKEDVTIAPNEPIPGRRRRYCIAVSVILGFFVFIFIIGISSSSSMDNNEDGHNTNEHNNDGTKEGPQTSKPQGSLDTGDFDVDEIFKNDQAMFIQSTSNATGRKVDLFELTEAAKFCHPDIIDHLPEAEARLKRADCGSGYDFKNVPQDEWRVMLYGSGWSGSIVDLSGCPPGNKCPLQKNCRIEVVSSMTNAAYLRSANVVVVFQKDAELLGGRLPPATFDDGKGHTKRIYRVFYWREAQWNGPSVHAQEKHYDFEMGVHYKAALPNPTFLLTPRDYISGLMGALMPDIYVPQVPPEKRKGFAMSLISHCNANSLRDRYQAALISTLGADRVHRYGHCGNKYLPNKPLSKAFEVIADYKFYFSFENEIQNGYVTEKLLFIFGLPPIPVYYGGHLLPNLTITPSYISASKFSTPKELALYLIHLSENIDEYNEYHKWKTDWSLFHPDYLQKLERRVAGPEERLVYLKKHFKRYPRTAQCCRLCDSRFVEEAAQPREPDAFVPNTWGTQEILKRYFDSSTG